MKTLTLCTLILTVACAVYAMDWHAIRSADAPRAAAEEPYWMPMSFDIETVPPVAHANEPAEHRDEQQARAPIPTTNDLQRNSSPPSADRTRASGAVSRIYGAVPSPS